MERVVVLGRGGAGKSVLARRLGERSGLPVVELDALYWGPDLAPRPAAGWAAIQDAALPADGRWIADGDLGPYDVLGPRLAAADTVVLLDFSLVRCVWRAARRSRERADFWRWVLTYRRRYRPAILRAVAEHGAAVHVLRSPREVERWLGQRASNGAA